LVAVAELRILAVDDDVSVSEYLRELLEAEGCSVTAANHPQRALELLDEQRFHLVTLDLAMPEMDGLELLRQIRARDVAIPAIILTAHASFETASAAIDLDVSAYLKKPFSADELRETVARVARKRGIVVRREDEVHVRTGDNIRVLRRSHNLTLSELSERTGLSRSVLSQIERGESSPSLSALFRIATALGATVADMVDES
jgi:DNA-binding NtrC family response regulator